MTYRQEHGTRGKLSRSPVEPSIDALDEAFYRSFAEVQPTSLVAPDVFGSMIDPSRRLIGPDASTPCR